jgi:SH3-like domain-containing protein
MRDDHRALLIRSLVVAGLAVGLGASVAGAADDSVRVRVDAANVREGPGTQYERLWTVGRDFPLEITARRGRWLKTRDFVGLEGWIFAPLTDAKAAAIVQVDHARVRSGPGRRHEVRFVAEWGEAFRVVSHENEWVKIDDAEEGGGWIHQSLVWEP